MGDTEGLGDRRSGYLLLVLWVVSTVIGAMVGQSLPGILFKDIGYFEPLTGIIDVFIVGIFVGFAQWLILREASAGIALWEWVVATGLGLFAGAAAILVLDTWGVHGDSSRPYLYAFGGTVFGLAQWMVLSKYLRRAGWWVLITTVAGALLYWIDEVDLPLFKSDVYAFFVAGILTGVGIIWLLREPVREEV